MIRLHLRKTNSPQTVIHVVEWICNFDENNVCTSCTTLEGEPSQTFIGKDLNYIDRWLNIGKVDNVAYHEIVSTL